jgi:hypothetical protein
MSVPGTAIIRVSVIWLVCAYAVPLMAQTAHPWDVSVGYSLMRDEGEQTNFPLGWNVSASTAITTWLVAMADVDGHRKVIPSIATDITLTSHAFSAGARASARLGAIVEFGQLTIGVVRSAGTLFDVADVTLHAMLQPGAGVDCPIASRWSVRAQVDGRFMRPHSEVRLVTSVVFHARR